MNHTVPERTPYDWLHFVRRSGGEAWSREYLLSQPLEELSTRSLRLLRERRFDEGYAPLERMGREIGAAPPGDPSVRAVLERWYYGVLGYYFYALERFDEADAAMARAHEAVSAAVARHRFLLPLANHCHEFRLHRARIARNRHHWGQMRAFVDEVRGMVTGATPYCVLDDGTPVWISDICGFYTSLPSPGEAEITSVSRLLDDRARLSDFEQFVRAMYRVPGFVIPYP